MIAPGAQPPVVWGSLNNVVHRSLDTDAIQEHGLKICFISGALPDVSCGIGDYVDALARALARRDHEIVVLTTASPDLRPSSEYRVVPLQTTWSLGEAGRIAAAVRRERGADET